MRDFRKLFAYTMLITGLLYSCDIFEEDVLPSGDDLFTVDTDIRLTQGSPFILDIGHYIQSIEDVKFKIGLPPEKGEIGFFNETYIKYEPKEDFTTGTDRFSVEMYNAEDVLLDADTITIEIMDSFADIPCFNGAASDHYSFDIEPFSPHQFQFDPVVNDGYCEDQVSSYEIKICVQPMHGSISKGDGSNLMYEPDSAFSGYDYFLYGLDLIDNDGVSHYSAAIVEFEVGESSDCRNVLFNIGVEYTIEDAQPDSLYAIGITNTIACDVTESWELDITEVEYGTAEPHESGTYILYTTPAEIDNNVVGVVRYKAKFMDGFFVEGMVHIYFSDSSTANCAEAYDDTYTYFAGQDTVTNGEYVFWMNPAENDSYCNESFELHVLQQPEYGEAIVNGQNVMFSMTELPSQYKEVTIKYEICNEGKCDYAFIYLGIDVDGTTSACVDAKDDILSYYADPDSTTQEVAPFIFDPVDNDVVCESTWEVDIVEAADKGVAVVLEDQTIQYTYEDSFTGERETTIKYKVCVGAECDYAYIYLTVHK